MKEKPSHIRLNVIQTLANKNMRCLEAGGGMTWWECSRGGNQLNLSAPSRDSMLLIKVLISLVSVGFINHIILVETRTLGNTTLTRK